VAAQQQRPGCSSGMAHASSRKQQRFAVERKRQNVHCAVEESGSAKSESCRNAGREKRRLNTIHLVFGIQWLDIPVEMADDMKS